MNKNQKKWVKALRSGKYKQTVGHLMAKDGHLGGEPFIGYCCLGVACEISRKELRMKRTNNGHSFSFGNEDEYLPDEVLSYLGITSVEGRLTIFDRDGESLSLVKLNDAGFTFDQIADVIEAGLVK